MISHYGSSPSYHKKSLHPIQKITWGKGTFQYIQSCESNGGRRSPLVVIFWSQQNFCYQNQSPTSSLEQLSTQPQTQPYSAFAIMCPTRKLFVSRKFSSNTPDPLWIWYCDQNRTQKPHTAQSHIKLPPPLVSFGWKNSLPPLNLRIPFQLHQYCHIPTQSPHFVCTREVAGTEWTNVPRC